MKAITISLLILQLVLLSATANAATHQAQVARIEKATAVLNEVMAIPETIPEDLIRHAYGIAVFPGVLKAAFLVGGRFGEGIFVARQANGNWSEPSLLNLYGASFGFQAGAESTDLILVFKTRQSVEALGRGDITLGGTMSVAAGPVGRSAQASTDIQLRAEIYSYSKTRGLFAGVALDGAGIQVDTGANNALYGTADPVRSAAVRVPEAAKRFNCVVSKYTGSPNKVCA
ncbi:MAG: lipid-binding SYLF domain-containing protein [Syntrophobacter sp.]